MANENAEGLAARIEATAARFEQAMQAAPTPPARSSAPFGKRLQRVAERFGV